MSLNQIERAQGLRIRSTQDFAGGLFMILLALGAYAFSWDLPAGSLRQLGPGMLPKAFAVICGVLGAILTLTSLRYHGEKLSGWSWKGVFFALGGACLLLAADIVGRIVARPAELDVGIVTAFIGAPFFIWIVRHQRVREL